MSQYRAPWSAADRNIGADREGTASANGQLQTLAPTSDGPLLRGIDDLLADLAEAVDAATELVNLGKQR
jgi:hypothetical protein